MSATKAPLRGSVQGEAARRYVDFTYRKPVMQPVTLHSVDPHRLDPLHEYPRDTCMDLLDLRTVDLADFEVRVLPPGPNGMRPAEVWMLPNEYTEARESRRVLEVQVSIAQVTLRRVLEEIARMAFRDPIRGPRRG
jgi:hypothetical protein